MPRFTHQVYLNVIAGVLSSCTLCKCILFLPSVTMVFSPFSEQDFMQWGACYTCTVFCHWLRIFITIDKKRFWPFVAFEREQHYSQIKFHWQAPFYASLPIVLLQQQWLPELPFQSGYGWIITPHLFEILHISSLITDFL